MLKFIYPPTASGSGSKSCVSVTQEKFRREVGKFEKCFNRLHVEEAAAK
jgi:hypothetical protein